MILFLSMMPLNRVGLYFWWTTTMRFYTKHERHAIKKVSCCCCFSVGAKMLWNLREIYLHEHFVGSWAKTVWSDLIVSTSACHETANLRLTGLMKTPVWSNIVFLPSIHFTLYPRQHFCTAERKSLGTNTIPAEHLPTKSVLDWSDPFQFSKRAIQGVRGKNYPKTTIQLIISSILTRRSFFPSEKAHICPNFLTTSQTTW